MNISLHGVALWHTSFDRSLSFTVIFVVVVLDIKLVFIWHLNGGGGERGRGKKNHVLYVTVKNLTLELWVCDVWCWFACLFQVGDHGADGCVTGDII